MILSWASTAGYTNPFQGINSKWLCASNYGHYCNPGWEAGIADAQGDFDDDSRNAKLKVLLNQMYEDAPALWVLLLHEAYAYSESVVADWQPRVGANPLLKLEDIVAV